MSVRGGSQREVSNKMTLPGIELISRVFAILGLSEGAMGNGLGDE